MTKHSVDEIISEELKNEQTKFKIIRIEDDHDHEEEVKNEDGFSVENMKKSAEETKDKVVEGFKEFSNKEDVQQQVQNTKEVFTKVGQKADEFINNVMDNDTVKDTINKGVKAKDEFFEREDVQKTIKDGKKSILNFGDKVWGKIRNNLKD